MKKIHKGDEVIVITGRDKGQRGHVLKVEKDNRVLISGINKKIKHVKPNPQKGIEGGKTEQEAPIHISNVMIFNPESQKADRVRIEVTVSQDENGKKTHVRERFYKSNNKKIG